MTLPSPTLTNTTVFKSRKSSIPQEQGSQTHKNKIKHKTFSVARKKGVKKVYYTKIYVKKRMIYSRQWNTGYFRVSAHSYGK